MNLSPRVKGWAIVVILGVISSAVWDGIKAAITTVHYTPVSFTFLRWFDVAYSVALASLGYIFGARPLLERRSLSLKKRTLQLATELLDFLREQGPEPPHALSGVGKVGEAKQRKIFNAYFKWRSDIYFKYMAHFKDRVDRIDRELAAEGIFTKLTSSDIEPPGSTQEVDVKKIGETLLLVASHMPDRETKSKSAAL